MPDAYIERTQEFFAERAATWDTRFGHDMPVYAAAIAEAGIARGGIAVDVGCGTGRALPALRDSVGPDGTVIGVELTPQMLAQARSKGWAASADLLLLADARHLPFATASVHALFAAGLVNHLPDPAAALAELARVTSPGGLLILFHPVGRAALAARHGRTISPDEILSPLPLRRQAATAGWDLVSYDDAETRFLAVARRALPATPAGLPQRANRGGWLRRFVQPGDHLAPVLLLCLNQAREAPPGGRTLYGSDQAPPPEDPRHRLSRGVLGFVQGPLGGPATRRLFPLEVLRVPSALSTGGGPRSRLTLCGACGRHHYRRGDVRV